MTTFTNWLADKNYHPKTTKEILTHIEYLQSYFDIGEEELKELRYENIMSYLLHIRHSLLPSTINQHTTASQ